jgi:hypothetical protein
MPMRARSFSSPDDLVTFVNDVQEVTVAALSAAGLGYTALDVLTVVGGVYTKPAKIRVDTVDGSGLITGSTLIEAGEYLSAPTNPASVRGGTGSGATFNLTLADLLVQADIVEIKPMSGRWLLNYWV